jgi:hypothetical protein
MQSCRPFQLSQRKAQGHKIKIRYLIKKKLRVDKTYLLSYELEEISELQKSTVIYKTTR